MSGALREIIAAFGIDFDPEGNLAKGDKHIDGVTEKLLGFGKIVAGAFAVDKILDFTKELIDEATALSRQATILGTSTKELEEWEYAAQRSGLSAEDFTAAVTKMSRNINEASENAGGNAAKAFKKLGVAVKDSSGKLLSPTDALDQLAVGLEGIHDPAQRTALVMDLFGRSGAQLLPFLSKGPEGLAKLRAEVDELGAGMDETFIKGAKEYKGNMARLNLALKGFGIQVIGPLLPLLGRLTTVAVTAAKGFVGWVKHTKLLQTAFIALIDKGVLSLFRSIPLLIARFGGLSAVLLRLGGFLLKTVAPFLILEDIIVFLAGGKSAIGKGLDKAFGPGTQQQVRELVLQFGKFLELFKTAPEQVRAAMTRVTNELTQKLGGVGAFIGGWWTAIADEGLFVVNILTGGWSNFATKMKALGQGILLPFKIIWTEIKYAGLLTAAALVDAFGSMWNTMISSAQAAINLLLDVMAKIPGAGEAARNLRADVAKADVVKASSAVDAVTNARGKERLAIAEEGDRIGAVATAPATSAATVTNNTTTNSIAPQINTTIHVEGGADVGNRLGKVVNKSAADGSLRGTRAALVPTPG